MLDAGKPRVALLARDLPADDPGAMLPLVADPWPVHAGDPPPVWVSEAVVDLHGARLGTRLQVPLAGRSYPFVVAGVWRDYARQQGALVIDRATYARLTGDTNATDAAIWLAPGVDSAAFRSRLEQRIPDAARMTLATPGEIRTLSLRVFDRTFAVTYGLLAAAVVIGLVGLSSSFGALVLARRREFGMLRHLGMTRRQIAAMLATEGLAVSSIGLAVGVALGVLMSVILIHVVNRQSFHWGMDDARTVGAAGDARACLARSRLCNDGGERAGGNGRRRDSCCQGGLVVRCQRPGRSRRWNVADFS